MKTFALILIFGALLLHACVVQAQVASSGNYAMMTDVLDAGGHFATAGQYASFGSVGQTASSVISGSSAAVVKSGYFGQIFDLTSLSVTASSLSVNVGSTDQLSATGVLDDATTVSLNPSTVYWALEGGPISGISSAGVVITGTDYDTTNAVIAGSYGTLTGTITLSVFNQGFDQWQTQYFGSNDPLAASGIDADGTGQTNLFKYIAGLNPLDPTSRFEVSVGDVQSQSNQTTIRFSPIVAGRTYVVQYSFSLNPTNWQALTDFSQSVNGNTMTVNDSNPVQAQKFYRVQISN